MGGHRRRAYVGFDPRPRAGGDGGRAAGSSTPCGFDPRPRAGGDSRLQFLLHGRYVSIRAPVRGATFSVALCIDLYLFRSAPPCGGRRTCRRCSVRGCGFRSAPPCGGRRSTVHAGNRSGQFRSAPPCGGRPRLICDDVHNVKVSIRAPVRGATTAPITKPTAMPSFDPRPRAGGDRRQRLMER